jgi:hypothetical protein
VSLREYPGQVAGIYGLLLAGHAKVYYWGCKRTDECVTISGMKDRRSEGSINILLIPFILVVLFFLGTAGFAFWAYSSRQDYKNNVDQKVSAAVSVAKQQESTAKDNEFVQKEKLPLRTYTGPQAYGSITVNYPKTWSAYVAEQDGGSTPVNGYFQPSVVPDVNNVNNSFALRVQVTQQSYDQVLQNFQGLVQTQKVTVAPYKLPNVANVVGSRIDGQITPNKSGSMVVFPLRDKTIEVWTEAQTYEADFNNNILPNLSFSP